MREMLCTLLVAALVSAALLWSSPDSTVPAKGHIRKYTAAAEAHEHKHHPVCDTLASTDYTKGAWQFNSTCNSTEASCKCDLVQCSSHCMCPLPEAAAASSTARRPCVTASAREIANYALDYASRRRQLSCAVAAAAAAAAAGWRGLPALCARLLHGSVARRARLASILTCGRCSCGRGARSMVTQSA
jgi:hypothetical protein